MGKATRFTDKFIQGLKPETKDYWVREGQGFAVRVYPSGEKSWYYVYTFEGRKRFMKLKDGGYPDVSLADARKAFDEAKREVANGVDPLAKKRQESTERREAPTVKKLAAEYMEKHAKKNKRESSWTEDQRLLDKNVLPAWGDLKAKDVKKRDVVLLLESYADRPALTHNVFKLVRKMFNFAVSRDILEYTPCTGINIDEIASITSRPRVLKEPTDNNGVDEILTFWTELEKASMSDAVKRTLKLILVTGQRPGEVAGICAKEVTKEEWEEKDSSGKVVKKWSGTWWTIPVVRRKVKEKSKNPPQPHRVYLSPMALELLGEPDKSGYYFPSPVIKHDENDKPIYQHIDENAVAYAIRRNLKDYKPRRPIQGKTVKMVKVKEDRKMNIEHFTPHDLRRTCSTRLAELGFKDEINDAILGHAKKGVVAIYNKYAYAREKIAAMEAWERKLNSILTGNENNVIPITAGKKVA